MPDTQAIDVAKVGLLRKAYDALAKQCAEAVIAIKKKEPEIQKRVQEEMAKIGLNLTDLKAKKLAAYVAWEAAGGRILELEKQTAAAMPPTDPDEAAKAEANLLGTEPLALPENPPAKA